MRAIAQSMALLDPTGHGNRPDRVAPGIFRAPEYTVADRRRDTTPMPRPIISSSAAEKSGQLPNNGAILLMMPSARGNPASRIDRQEPSSPAGR
jgi:hypothetical protein